MKILSTFLFVFLSCSYAVADENDFRCFVSIGTKTPIKLQFNLPKEGHPGQVIYQKGTGPIELKLIREKELERGPDGRPSLFETVFEEVMKKGSGGRYVWISQGAVTSDFKFVRQKDGKVIKFEEDLGASGDNGCEWGPHHEK